MFSFNNPFGACPKCTGLGYFQRVDPDLIVPNKELSIKEGAIKASGWNTLNKGSIAMMYYTGLAEHFNISLDTPFKDLPKEAADAFLYGTGEDRIEIKIIDSFGGGTRYSKFEGVIINLE